MTECVETFWTEHACTSADRTSVGTVSSYSFTTSRFSKKGGGTHYGGERVAAGVIVDI